MRISRRPFAAAVVLGVSLLACYEQGVHLSSTEEEVVVFLPATNYDFGTVALGQNVATNPDPYFTVRAQSPTDDDQVNVTKSATCGADFKLDLQPPLPASQAHVFCSMMMGTGAGMSRPENGSTQPPMCAFVDYQFGATFTPSQTGMQTCPVTVTSSPTFGGASMTYTITLTGSGQGSSYSMDVQPKTLLDFGDVPLNTATGDQSVTVINNGTSPIDVTSSNTDAVHFISNPLMGATTQIPPTGFKTFQVHCQTDATVTTHNATFTFTTPGNEGGLSGTVTARCNAIAASVIVTPNPIPLGTHLIGDSPTTKTVTIQNTSASPIQLSGFAFSGEPPGEVTFVTPPGSPTVGGMASITVDVKYAPTTERDVGPMGTMQFVVSGATTVNTPLQGGAHFGSIGTNPGMFDFGTVCAGSMKSLDMAVFANAGGDVTLTGKTGPTAPFSATLGTINMLLGHHGNEVLLSATAQPASNRAPGEVNDMVSLQTNIPNMGSIAIPMHAVVLAGGISPTPTAAHFGPSELLKASSGQTITLTNCGSSDFTLTDVSFTGANADEFQIVSPTDPHVMIKQTESASFLVVLIPTSAGPKTAQMVFAYPGGTTTVDLDGTGIGPGDTTGGKDRETYYACSAGGGGAASMLPIALAVCAARRRRSRARRAR
ncbi:MAG: choice-of-anchor D domain-containing protein [Deltaproteobacteria bacterium]|nr:choice-of-anchor D domain-containing protein [Deltaproteobacteria bacterium]